MPASAAAPAIYIQSSSSDRYGHSEPHGIYSSSVAMSIPGSVDPRDAPPPPLPPPRFFPPDGPYPEESQSHYHRSPASYSPRSGSQLGSIGSSLMDYRKRDASSYIKMEKDEGYASLSSAGSTRSEYSLPGFGSFHNRFQLESGADALADMKKKLDPLRTLDNRPSTGRSLLTASVNDAMGRRLSNEHRLPALSLPLHPKANAGLLDSPDRFTQTPHSALTPLSGSHFSAHSPLDYRSPKSVSDADRSPPNRTKRLNSDDASTQGSYEIEDMEMEETSMNRLRIDEHHATGSKRRASSPPGEGLGASLLGPTTQGEMVRRRDVTSRGSPTPRLGPVHESPAPHTTERNRSFNLSLLTGSSVTGLGSSFGGLSPGGLSPGALSGGLSPIATDHSCSSPYSTPMSTNPSPRASLSRAPHQRTFSDGRPFASPRKLTEGSKLSGAKIQGFFMCECCPKKPKKFETAEELAAHEQEKQYECNFCGNRFKNKNEAERHQNSLHVRRHSWSCSALKAFDRAFHESTNRPGEADACGYCGEDFPRSGIAPGASTHRHVTDQNWEERIRHLQEVHKFRECNSSKKFFRADHFRQHLKHSHAGTSGKWTNMLENACMIEEDPTPR